MPKPSTATHHQEPTGRNSMNAQWISYFDALLARSAHPSPECRRTPTPHPIFYMHLILVHHRRHSHLIPVPHSSRNDWIATSLTHRPCLRDLLSQAKVLDKPSMAESNPILIKTWSLIWAVRSVEGELVLRLCWKRLEETRLGMERSISKVKERKPEVERAMINRHCYGDFVGALCNAIPFHLRHVMRYFSHWVRVHSNCVVLAQANSRHVASRRPFYHTHGT